MSQYEMNAWMEVTYPEIQHGYKQDLNSKYHGFTNYSTAKVMQYITYYEDFQTELRKKEGQDFTNSVSSVLAGIHFNNGEELKEYMMKFMPLDSLKPEEYAYVNWKEVWTQMGHEDDFGIVSDIGLTGSKYEQFAKDNPDYADVLDKLNTEVKEITPQERIKFKIENATIIIRSLLTRIFVLRRCDQAKEELGKNITDLKRTITDLYQTCKEFPYTGDALVDNYLSKCRLA